MEIESNCCSLYQSREKKNELTVYVCICVFPPRDIALHLEVDREVELQFTGDKKKEE